MSLPGFMIPAGSSAVLIARSAASLAGPAVRTSSASFDWPMPCSAEIEPPDSPTKSWTSRVTALA
jgi:hypothetical protein